ncbi:hypothetical protein ACL9RF_14680 [Sphingobacterium sp. Mn56C]|uniref:hypothetical protein n=1 Tax=Sphingobacterium sp. Mn56C TaxID=3395261 RepID=UPI003BD23120
MKNLFYQTKQAFYFSLAFYSIAFIFMVLQVSIAPILFSISLLVSLIWVFLVLRELMLSRFISNSERLLVVLFIILFNIVAGIVYFYFLRERVIGKQNS